MKLSVQLICACFLAALFYSSLAATNTSSDKIPVNTCLPPGLPVIVDITSASARLTWGASADAGLITYEWKIVPEGLSPEPPTTLSGFSVDTSEWVGSLDADFTYDVYVRSNCGDPTDAEWVGPVTFTTPPGCGDVLFDSGGSLSSYQNGEYSLQTICPDVPGTVVSIAFIQFELANGDTMRIFNGAAVTDVLFDTYSQATGAPFTVISSNPSGCLTVEFTSDMEKVAAGWVAAVTCVTPEICFPVEEVNVFNFQPVNQLYSVSFSWPAVFGSIGYEWEITNLQDMPLFTGGTLGTSVTVSGLAEATYFKFNLRSLCVVDDESTVYTSIFATPINCANAPTILCGSSSGTISVSGQGVWQADPCGGFFNSTIGKERVFRFVAPHTRMYTFQTNVGTGAGFVSYGYKESIKGCGPFDWDCIGSFQVNQGSSTTFGPLVAGQEYLILFDAETTSFVSHSFRIRACDPPNDEAPTAVTLLVDSPCIGNIYSNNGATFNIVDTLGQEPNPDDQVMEGLDDISGRWLTAADETVWFKFKAPPSGSVIVSTESIPQSGNFDTQLAMYETVDSSSYKFFKLIVSDDDNGNNGLGYNSVFSYSGLTPGATYYIQVDGYSTFNGNFCIEIKEGVIRLNESECTPGYFVENVDGTIEGGDRWYDIYSRPDELDLGDLLVAIKPGIQNLDTVFCQMSVFESIPISTNPFPYMPAYVSLRSTKGPDMPYTIRMFFHQAEFDSLVAVSGLDPLTTTIDQLVATHYTGPNEDCFQQNNTYELDGGTGVATLITDLKVVYMPASKMFYVELDIPSNGEVGVHLQQSALPIELESFTGKIVENANRLEWTTLTEKNVAWHLVERSADGVNWTVVERQAGQSNATSPTHYTFDDINPFPKSYYRLRTLDFDGLSMLSSIVVLARQGTSLEIDRVFPSPTQDRLQVVFSSPEETELIIRVNDITGHVVLEEYVATTKGQHSATISLQSLPPGMYIVSLSDGISVAAPVRVIKK